jgi:hypothetical protein
MSALPYLHASAGDSPVENASHGSAREVIATCSRNGDDAWFRGMFVMMVTASNPNKPPAVLLEARHDLGNFHSANVARLSQSPAPNDRGSNDDSEN